MATGSISQLVKRPRRHVRRHQPLPQWLPKTGTATPPTDPANYPTLFLRFAPGSVTLSSPAWQDITTYLDGFSTKRGRQTELDRFEAGQASFGLQNRDRRFEPGYASSPYYPGILPLRRVQLLARWQTVVYPVWTGFIEEYPIGWWRLTGARVDLKCSDGFTILAGAAVSAEVPSELGHQRLQRICQAVGWLAEDQLFAAGLSTLKAETLSNANALGHLQEVALAESGKLFMNAAGQLAFHNRHTSATGAYAVSQATFGDSGAELGYADLQPAYDQRQLFNDIRITAADGVERTASDQTSIETYGTRTMARTLKLQDGNEAQDLADFLSTRYPDPALRFTSMKIFPGSDGANLWPQVLGREIGDRITVRRRPPGGGAILEQISVIEGISHAVSGQGHWETVWALSPVGVSYSPGPMFTLDDPTLGQLGGTGVLVY